MALVGAHVQPCFGSPAHQRATVNPFLLHRSRLPTKRLHQSVCYRVMVRCSDDTQWNIRDRYWLSMGNDVRVIRDAEGGRSTCFLSAEDTAAEISAEVERTEQIIQRLIWSKYQLMAGVNKTQMGFFLGACQ